MHLAETSTSYINNKLKGDAIETIYLYYQMAYWDKNTWRPIFIESIARLYSKLNYEKKNKFKNLILEDFKDYLFNNNNKENTRNIDYAKSLIKKLRLENDLIFVQDVIAIVQQTIDLLNNPPFPSYLDIAHEGLMFFFDEFLCKSNERTISSLREQIRELISITPDLFLASKAKLLLHYVDSEQLDSALSEKSLALEKFLKKHGEIIIGNELECQEMINELCILIFQTGHKLKSLSETDRYKRKSVLVRATRNVLKALSSIDIDDYDVDEIGELLLVGLTHANIPELYDWILTSALIIQPSYLNLKIPNNESFFDYINNLIESNKSSFNEESIDKLLMSLNIIENARNQFARFREGFIEILKGYVIENHEAFENSQGGYISATHNHPNNSNYFEITNKFNSILTNAISDSEIFDYDKKFIIDKFTSFNNIRYFRNYFIPSLWGRDFNLYQDEYWELIMGYTQSSEDIKSLVTILRNSSIYKYYSNIFHLQKILDYYLTIDSSIIPDNFELRLFEMLSAILNLLKNSKNESNQADVGNILQTTILLARKYNLSQILNTESLISLNSDGMTLYILLYYFTLDDQYNFNVDYDNLLSDHVHDRTRLMTNLIDLFIVDDYFESKEFEKINPVIGDGLAKRIREYLKFHNELTHPFSRDEFEEKLRQ